MQNAQNTEIQQRVINLVELYRTKVGKESQIAKDAKSSYDYEQQYLIDSYIRTGMSIGLVGEVQETSIKHLMVNEQLLGHFFIEVAGKEAYDAMMRKELGILNKAKKSDKLIELTAILEDSIKSQLLPQYYDKTVFTSEEETFLKSHFKELVNYIILTPCDDSLCWVNRDDTKDKYTIPSEVLHLIASRVKISLDSVIYYPFPGYAQMANLFNRNKYLLGNGYVGQLWMQVATFANEIDADFVKDRGLSSLSFDSVISFIPEVSENSGEIIHIHNAYNRLPVEGKLVLLCPSKVLWKKDGDEENCPQEELRKQLVSDNSIVEIIQLPSVMSPNLYSREWCLLIAEKGNRSKTTTMIDAKEAFKDALLDHILTNGVDYDNNPYKGCQYILDNKDWREVQVRRTKLDVDNLTPQVYILRRPTLDQAPMPLDSICKIVTDKVRSLDIDLPLDTPWVKEHNLSILFQGALDMSNMEKAACPNNPPFVEGSNDYFFDKKGNFIDSVLAQIDTLKGVHVAKYRDCTFVDGNRDVVLCKFHSQKGLLISIVQATGKPFAVDKDIVVFCPTGNFDAKSFAAILRLPIVFIQIQTYQDFGLKSSLKDILVPTDEYIINGELYRMKREENITSELGEKAQAMKTEYINEVRMRKHDMRPHLRQLASSERLMLHYLDNVNNIDELKKNLRNQLEHSQNALDNLSTIIDHLSDEEKFGEPEMLNIDSALSDIEVNHDDSEGFVLEYDCDNDSFRNHGIKIPNIAEQLDFAKDQGLDMVKFMKVKSHEELPLFTNIASVDFQRLVSNIIENARRHGFTDKTREDYYIGIELSYNSERGMYQIDFVNNGTPLPEGMTKVRYGIKGDKAGLTAGSGSGGYIVKSIVNHYGGDYDVFCKDRITTIRILLPIITI